MKFTASAAIDNAGIEDLTDHADQPADEEDQALDHPGEQAERQDQEPALGQVGLVQRERVDGAQRQRGPVQREAAEGATEVLLAVAADQLGDLLAVALANLGVAVRVAHQEVDGGELDGFEELIGLLAAAWMYWLFPAPLADKLALPVFKEVLIPLGPLFPLLAMLVMMGASNAVNLTDGLDGLAIVPAMIAAAVFALIAWVVGNRVFADYLQLHYVPGSGELAVFLSAMIGAGLGFLWFNAPPAAVFMGDTGSLSLGGALGAVAVATKHEIVLAIVGGLFLLEALSVIIQVASFKLTKKRVFLMAPIHHHFEKLGWSESTVVIRFWIIAFLLALAGLATLRLR